MSADTLVLHLRIVGVVMAWLVIVNLIVPKWFRWREEMAALSALNRQIFLAHNVFLILSLAMLSALLLTSATALLEPTPLSRMLLIGLAIFWGLRMVMQWAFYSADIWRGHRFYTAMHYVFSAVWIYVTAVFTVAAIYVG